MGDEMLLYIWKQQEQARQEHEEMMNDFERMINEVMKNEKDETFGKPKDIKAAII